jgi:hypothetical protein
MNLSWCKTSLSFSFFGAKFKHFFLVQFLSATKNYLVLHSKKLGFLLPFKNCCAAKIGKNKVGIFVPKFC